MIIRDVGAKKNVDKLSTQSGRISNTKEVKEGRDEYRDRDIERPGRETPGMRRKAGKGTRAADKRNDK